jgi:hypothetical protein
MEKQCEVCEKKYTSKRKTQKYCSVDCQYESYRKPKIEKVITTCNFCNFVPFRQLGQLYGRYV